MTVVFCDLVDSTEMAHSLDPEEYRTILAAYHRASAAAIERFGGIVAQFLGDGVLAYFGYPQAHEDEASRAVGASLALRDEIARLPTHDGIPPVRVRVGVATGLVVVGQESLSAGTLELSVAGDTPNLAARLQALAGPGEILIAESTHRLVASGFELEWIGTHPLKGFAAPMRTWRVLGTRAVEAQFEARAARAVPLVGRREEIALLARYWELARGGRGHVVILSGEPGIGKSRLAMSLYLHARTASNRRYQCSPYGLNSGFHPIIAHIEHAAGFAREDSNDAKLDKLERYLAAGARPIAAIAPLFAALLSLSTGSRYRPLALSPQKQKERTIEALIEHLVEPASGRPVLCLVEDLQWADPSTLEVLDRVVDRIRSAPFLLLATARPDFTPRWRDRPHVAVHSLARLTPRHSERLIARIVRDRQLPPDVISQVVAKTDGVPLFVEELTKAVLEGGLLRQDSDQRVPAGPLPPLAIPVTLQDSLMARLDRLSPLRGVAQIGAAIGREFRHDLIAAVCALPESQLMEALNQLVDAELIFVSGSPPETVYAFKHALVQDAAYGSLLKSRRQQLHARIAAVLEEHFPETTVSHPQLLAYHFERAGIPERAVFYGLRAAEHALRGAGWAEAIAQLAASLALVQELPVGPARQQQELALRIALAAALQAARGVANPEVGAALSEAFRLCEPVASVRQRLSVLGGLCLFHLTRSELDLALRSARQLARLGVQQGDPEIRMNAHRFLGSILVRMGRLQAARRHMACALELRREASGGAVGPVTVMDPEATTRSILAWIMALLGYPDQARANRKAAVARAQELQHAPSLGNALSVVERADWILREDGALRWTSEMLAALAAEQQGFPGYKAIADIRRGAIRADAGEVEEGIALIRAGLEAYRSSGAQTHLTHALAVLGSAYRKGGRLDDSIAALEEGLQQARRTGEVWCEAELMRLKGAVLLDLRQAAQAEECFLRSLEIARAQQARWWELRIATSLAALWRDSGRAQDARGVLSGVHDWFTEGFDTKDLSDARAVLDDLA